MNNGQNKLTTNDDDDDVDGSDDDEVQVGFLYPGVKVHALYVGRLSWLGIRSVNGKILVWLLPHAAGERDVPGF